MQRKAKKEGRDILMAVEIKIIIQSSSNFTRI